MILPNQKSYPPFLSSFSTLACITVGLFCRLVITVGLWSPPGLWLLVTGDTTAGLPPPFIPGVGALGDLGGADFLWSLTRYTPQDL